MSWVNLLLIWLVTWLLVLVLRYRKVIVACWLEPVLSKPVLIFESDDWGPGPDDDAVQLRSIAVLLGHYQDSLGRHPVMTLGVILAVPDSLRIKASGYESYHRQTLGEERFELILNAMQYGIDKGVFTAQLHGMEHYWPKKLMEELNANDQLKSLLDCQDPLRTESLADTLQSRWLEGGGANRSPLPKASIERAVKEEAYTFTSLFGRAPMVIVPPTFVWNHKVEIFWRSFGLCFLVTPGFIATGRDEQGVMGLSGQLIYNGMKAKSGLVYIVRNNYFEPSLGHTVAQALLALADNTVLGRPTLFETHRFNFCDDEQKSRNSLDSMAECIESAQSQYPSIHFISTAELGNMYLDANCVGSLIDQHILSRFMVFMARLWACEAMRKWFYFSGLFVVVKTLSIINKWR